MLSVAAELQIGQKLYATHALALRLRRGLLPIVDRLDVSLPHGIALDPTLGDDVVLKLDGGEGHETVFTGKLSAHCRSLAGPRVTAHNGALPLARYRPSLSLEQISIGDIVRRLCGDASVDTGAIADGPQLTLYVADGRATALDEVPRLGRLAGAEAAFDGDGKVHLFDATSNGPGGEAALKYGRELLELEVERIAADDSSLTVAGDGAGDPGSPLQRWPIVDFFQGSADDPGPAARRRAAPELRKIGDARAAATAWSDRVTAQGKPVRMRAWLLPALQPGALVHLQDLPDDVDLPAFRVRQVIHVLDDRGGYTEVRGSEGGGGGGAGGLAGLAGALL